MKRRFFLQGIGGAAVAVPYLSSVHNSAQAQPSAPQRVVLFHTPHGCLTNRWFPKVENGPLTAEALSGTTIEGLSPFADKLLVPRGLTAINGMGRPQFTSPHNQAMGSKLTCAPLDTNTNTPTSHSLDQEIARQVNVDGADPLVISVNPTFADPATYLSYSGPLTPHPFVVDPLVIYSRLTGLFTGGPATEADYRIALGQSSLDVVRDDLMRYKAQNMSASDQQRVDAWLELLRQSEPNVTALAGGCSEDRALSLGITPEALALAQVAMAPESGGSEFGFTVRGDLLMNLVALTMICDANRSLIFSYPGYATFTWDGMQHTSDSDGLNHRSGSALGVECLDGVLDMLAELDVWYAGKYLRLIKLFDDIPEGEGSLLDNTATVWLREFSDGGSQTVNNMPILIAGSAGGYLKQGVAVGLEDDPIGVGNSEANCTEPGDYANEYMGTDQSKGIVPINKLYVTLMNAVGCTGPGGGPVEQFGVFDGDTIEAGITDPGELSALRA